MYSTSSLEILSMIIFKSAFNVVINREYFARRGVPMEAARLFEACRAQLVAALRVDVKTSRSPRAISKTLSGETSSAARRRQLRPARERRMRPRESRRPWLRAAPVRSLRTRTERRKRKPRGKKRAGFREARIPKIAPEAPCAWPRRHDAQRGNGKAHAPMMIRRKSWNSGRFSRSLRSTAKASIRRGMFFCARMVPALFRQEHEGIVN